MIKHVVRIQPIITRKSMHLIIILRDRYEIKKCIQIALMKICLLLFLFFTQNKQLINNVGLKMYHFEPSNLLNQ